MLQIQNMPFKLNRLLDNIPMIYVACLAAYNNAYLHGQWIDATQGEATVREEIQIMLEASPIPAAEEWAIHDTSGFYEYNVRESEDIEKLCEIASMIYEADKEASGKGYVMSHLINEYGISGAESQFDYYFFGTYESDLDFAYQYIDETCFLENVPESVLMYFDYEAFARDIMINDFYSVETDNENYYFRNN